MKTIGIFPASSQLGVSTTAHLLKLIPGDRLVLISRNPEKLPKEYSQSGAQLRKASYESPDEMETAFKGVDVLFLISYPSHIVDFRIKLQLPAVDAALRAGVSHIFYSSLAFAGPPSATSSKGHVMHAHLATESHLRSLAAANPGKFSYTSVREGLYSESWPIYTAMFSPSMPASEIKVPHDGAGPGLAFAKRDELGEATARLVARFVDADVPGLAFDRAELTNKTLLLTGPRVWTLREVVEQLQSIVGKPLQLREVTVDEYVSQPKVLERFRTAEIARTWATAYEAIKEGETSVVTPTLQEVLGRAPEEFDVTVRKQILGQ